jgi:hypothetical protein
MYWKHKRNRSTAEAKKHEPRTGTRWSFVAAAVAVA